MNQEEIKDQGGRPTKYKTAYNRLVYQLALLGATDVQIAEALDVSIDTITEWKKKKTGGFSVALKGGKTKADSKVAAALYKRAIGFKYDEVTYEVVDGKTVIESTSTGDVKQPAFKKKVVTKLVIPDTGAITLWLKNRQSSLWRDKMPDEFDRLTDEQVEQLFERLKKMANNETGK